MTETEKAYIAGLIDGDGCILVNRQTRKKSGTVVYQLRVVVAMNDQRPLVFLKDKLDGGLCTRKRQYRGEWKTTYVWSLCDQRASNLLEAILPYLLVKDTTAKIGTQLRSVTNDATLSYEEKQKRREKHYLAMRRHTRNRTNKGNETVLKANEEPL